MKIITYVIVTWNNQNQIKACIDSIKNNTSISFDIFIIDNNSSDKTCEIIKKYFPDVILFRNVENLGFAKGNNLALKYVKSEYICFINPDIILTEDIVSPSINILNKEKSVGLVASRLCNLDGSHQPSCFAFATPFSLFCEILHIGKIMPQFICKKYFPNFYHAKKSFFPPWVIGAEMVMRTYEAKKINGFSTE